MGYMYNQKNVGVVFVVMGSVLLILVAGEFAFKLIFTFLALICVDYGLRLMGQPPFMVWVQGWLDRMRS